MYFNIRILTSM